MRKKNGAKRKTKGVDSERETRKRPTAAVATTERGDRTSTHRRRRRQFNMLFLCFMLCFFYDSVFPFLFIVFLGLFVRSILFSFYSTFFAILSHCYACFVFVFFDQRQHQNYFVVIHSFCTRFFRFGRLLLMKKWCVCVENGYEMHREERKQRKKHRETEANEKSRKNDFFLFILHE